jgi:hypothetical protein
MEITFTLADELRALAASSEGNASFDPADALTRLAQAARVAVASCTAVMVMVERHGQPVTLAVACSESAMAPALSSLRLDLSGLAGAGPEAVPVEVIFLASSVSAFDGLARDLPPAYFHDRMTLDTDLTADLGGAAEAGSVLGAASIVDRAIGVLIEGGLRPDEAVARLRDQADAAAIRLEEAAHAVLASTQRPIDGRGPPAGKT